MCIFLAVMLIGCSGGGSTGEYSGDPIDPGYLPPSGSPGDGNEGGVSGDPFDPSSPPPPGYNPPAAPPPAGGGGGDPYDTTYYENYGTNEFISTDEETTSTFGMDVDTAAYTIARYYLNDGNMPEKDSVRTEEFINYFDQDYPQPGGDRIFSLSLEGAKSRYGQPDYYLLRIGVKAMDIAPSERPSANMVFVIDVSGSMGMQNRLEQVKVSLQMLAENLHEGDKIGLVIYHSSGEVISGLTSDHDAIMTAIEDLYTRGSTNAGEGLVLAYEMARAGYEEGKINRIILCSDGVANTGITDPDAILAQVKEDAGNGITLTTMGFGMGNYNDVLMEKLANNGNGCYYYIDSNTEAARLFSEGALRMLMTLALDAKVQVIFNAETVEEFRLLGYENRALNEEDFEDNTKDAGDVGPGQTVTALYEIRIRDEALEDSMAVVATVKTRCMNFETKEIEEHEQRITVWKMTRSFKNATRRFQFTAAVAEFAEILRESQYADESTFESVLAVVEEIAVDGKEMGFVELVNAAIQIYGE